MDTHDESTTFTLSDNESWFTTQVDRCFEKGTYGMGIRLYRESKPGYTHIRGLKYNSEKGELSVETATEKHEQIVLKSEPDIEKFKASIGRKWKEWDSINGKLMEEDRPDYCPWAHSSLSSLASELKLHDGPKNYCKP